MFWMVFKTRANNNVNLHLETVESLTTAIFPVTDYHFVNSILIEQIHPPPRIGWASPIVPTVRVGARPEEDHIIIRNTTNEFLKILLNI